MHKNETEIRELMAAREEAMRAGDADRLTADYTADTVKFDLAPPLRHVAPEVQDTGGVRAWFETFSGPVDYEVRDLTVTASDDIAFCHSLNRMSAVPHGGERFDLWFRGTVCLQRLDGTWRITHEHSSTPFYMDGSFGAALDLAP